MVGQYAGTLPRPHLRGTWEHPLLPLLPRQPTGTGAGPAPMVAEQRARRRSRYAYQVAVQVGGRPSCEPRTANVRPSLPARPDSGSDDQAAHRPQRHVQPGAPMWPVPPHRRIPDPARSGQRGCSGCGHRTRVRPDTPDHPGRVDTGRLDIRRPPDQLDGRPSAWRTADADPATTAVAGVRTSWTATTTATAGWAARTSLGLQRLRRWSIHDGSAVTHLPPR
jgi:hypothetical protein